MVGQKRKKNDIEFHPDTYDGFIRAGLESGDSDILPLPGTETLHAAQQRQQTTSRTKEGNIRMSRIRSVLHACGVIVAMVVFGNISEVCDVLNRCPGRFIVVIVLQVIAMTVNITCALISANDYRREEKQRQEQSAYDKTEWILSLFVLLLNGCTMAFVTSVRTRLANVVSVSFSCVGLFLSFVVTLFALTSEYGPPPFRSFLLVRQRTDETILGQDGDIEGPVSGSNAGESKNEGRTEGGGEIVENKKTSPKNGGSYHKETQVPVDINKRTEKSIKRNTTKKPNHNQGANNVIKSKINPAKQDLKIIPSSNSNAKANNYSGRDETTKDVPTIETIESMTFSEDMDTLSFPQDVESDDLPFQSGLAGHLNADADNIKVLTSKNTEEGNLNEHVRRKIRQAFDDKKSTKVTADKYENRNQNEISLKSSSAGLTGLSNNIASTAPKVRTDESNSDEQANKASHEPGKVINKGAERFKLLLETRKGSLPEEGSSAAHHLHGTPKHRYHAPKKALTSPKTDTQEIIDSEPRSRSYDEISAIY